MSREKHHKKLHRNSATNENNDKNERSQQQLFSEADAKSVEVSGYTVGRGAPQSDQRMQIHGIPTGVVDIDESVKLPTPHSKSRHRGHDSEPYTVLRPSANYNQENVHLPPISNHPNGYYYSPSDYYYGHYPYPYPFYYENYSPDHHHHHHHRHHHHHKHVKEVETYDPRWWYLPPNLVHGPKPWQPPEYHYVQPKWYETSSSLSRLSINAQQRKSPPRKYVDCRCEVCRPSKKTSHGIRWVVNE